MPSDRRPIAVADLLRRELLEKHGFSVTRLAGELEITRPALSNVLNGNAALSIQLALKVEQRFQISARDLLISQLDEDLAIARQGVPD